MNRTFRTLAIDFSNLLQDPIDYNVKIVVGEGQNIKEYRLHSPILASRSAYFKNALSARWARKEDGIIIFNKPNISYLVFEVLIKYIYSGTLSIENNDINLFDVAIAADELELLEVYQQIEEVLLENESAWRPRDIIKICQLDNFNKLHKVALGLVCKNPEIIFESKEFLNMEETNLIQLLKCDYLKLEEIDLWEYLIKWGIENTSPILDNDLIKWTKIDFENLEKTLHNCIPFIRFFQMSPHDYTKVRTKFKDILPDGLDDQYFSNSSSKPSFDVLPPRYLIDSKIINSIDTELIASWIDKKQGTPYHFKDLPFKFNLIYRSSREGFEIDKFHNICDNKGPTIVVIKVHNSGEIIGGYNPLEWRCIKKGDDENSLLFHNQQFYENHHCSTSNSFIFSLTNRATPILSRVTSKKEAIIWCKNRGPCFGLQDLCISSSRSSRPFNNIIGKSKQHSYEKKIIDRETFEIEEYEVFQIIDNRFRMFKFIWRMIGNFSNY
ncbi:hypothetical protein C1645_873637 [Glomus cerebriforme]|uniref:BTB/POZ domain-containing protein n=1 Tax=Glomus cerebriforme TaxID=658196 RepID=A0A397T7K3_9GLOM|nr:hypothetical protein C1645_873637 [Glomus cerebriforme]